ncbi:MAG: 5-formyltetrahydrofolate cyclo-ligase [Arhodomonas sp.]|nr:5-formyltetrahydrofolate cyclo-ligase [Arhodomonas sp.]
MLSSPAMTAPPPSTDRQALRREMRRRRRRLPPRMHRLAAAGLTRALMRAPLWRRVRHVAAFAAADGEPDLWRLMHAAHHSGHRVYLPVIAASNRPLRFRRWRPGARMVLNRFGIPEPAGGAPLHPRRLDLVLTPLVAFDRRGNRLGMGGGLYDRSFAFLHLRRRWHHPRLVGVAHAFQQVPELDARPWDVPLWGVLTPEGLRRFPLGRASPLIQGPMQRR